MAGYLINRTPTPWLDGKMPYEVLFGKPPQYNLMRVFCCLCYAHRQTRDKDKFGERSRKAHLTGVFLGRKLGMFMTLRKMNAFCHVM